MSSMTPSAAPAVASSTAQNPRKRPQTSTPPTSSGPDRKRARIISARTISSQSTLPELKSGALNVAAFVKSRNFEISALQRSMANSKAGLKQRAFQSVPRDLRRRTASHNAKRVPKRLREQATREMAEDKTPTHTFRRRPKSGHDLLRAETAEKLRTMAKKKEVVERLTREEKTGELRKPPRGHSKFRKRQKAKTWLPTHVWHAKRAHIEVRWRFAVVESPNEKSFRNTQRAVEKRGAVAWDTSYWASILVRGEEDMVVSVLEAVCRDAAGDKRVRMGKRSKECWAYHRGGFPTKPIAPVIVVWSPVWSPAEANVPGRRVLVRVHPSAFHDVWEELLEEMRVQNLTAGLRKVFVDDLRFELGSIQISGPAATDALLSVLIPLNPDGEAEKVWAGLRGVTNPLSLPSDAAFGFNISDPRLRFPPRLAPSPLSPEAQQKHLYTIQSTWPVPPTPYSLLDPIQRTTSVKHQASQKRIAKRKSDASPGQFPPHLPNDPSIPIILLATPLCASGGSRTAVNKGPGSWTILLPWKWIQPVWYALMHTTENVRFGGVQEQRQVAFDHGLPWFPADYPGTRAGQVWEDDQALIRKETWDKKPKQKRLNFDAVLIAGKKGECGEWSRCDWDLLVPTAQPDKMDIDAGPAPTVPPKPYWHVPSNLVSAFLQVGELTPSLKNTPKDVLSTAIFNVKITLSHRGAPSDTARIYRLPATDTAWTKLGAAIHNAKGKKKVEKQERGVLQAGQPGYPECPGEEDLVGFVSTGNYSLTEGRMVAVGGIVWGSWFTGEEGRERRKGERWCVVRGVGETVGRLGRWEII